MSIVYDPKKLLQRIAPKKKIENLLSSNASLKKTALSFVDSIDFLNKKDVTRVALKTVKQYKQRIKREVKSGETKSAAVSEIVDDPKLLIQRVQNEVVTQVASEIKDQYNGEYYVWLPSDASEPDPLHQLNYGKTFQIGVGEMPGDRYGCRCGMEILVKESQINLSQGDS